MQTGPAEQDGKHPVSRGHSSGQGRDLLDSRDDDLGPTIVGETDPTARETANIGSSTAAPNSRPAIVYVSLTVPGESVALSIFTSACISPDRTLPISRSPIGLWAGRAATR